MPGAPRRAFQLRLDFSTAGVDGSLTLQQVQQSNDWHTNHDSTFSQGYSPSTWWLKWSIHNGQAAERWLLEISYPVLDHLHL